jgi:putative membrane protein
MTAGCISVKLLLSDRTARGEQMAWIIIGLALLIGALHVYILVMEMFLWETPRVMQVFSTNADFAARSKTLAANQGLYNGFLAAGLFWGIFQGVAGRDVLAFFLICVVIAGVYGGISVSKRIFTVQALPAILALAALALS